jgi:hypothetical protein
MAGLHKNQVEWGARGGIHEVGVKCHVGIFVLNLRNKTPRSHQYLQSGLGVTRPSLKRTILGHRHSLQFHVPQGVACRA